MTPGARTCLFCGSAERLTREHIFGDWISSVAPDQGVVGFVGGPFNRLDRHFGTGPAYSRTVKEVCARCNSGWMGALESAVRPLLSPLIQGEAIAPSAQEAPLLGRWLLKTTLMALRVSTPEDRANGYGVPPSEYRDLYEHREDNLPVEHAQFWAGRYVGESKRSGCWAMPFVITPPGVAHPPYPHGYAMAVIVGGLILVGVKFTDPDFEIPIVASELWALDVTEDNSAATRPSDVDDDLLPFILRAGIFMTPHAELRLVPWAGATDLDRSELDGGVIVMPAMCGKHQLRYPAQLAELGMRGRGSTFLSSCPCSAYLLQTHSTGVRVLAAGEKDAILDRYERTPGTEYELSDEYGTFFFKSA